jgi:hypothetical protein
MGGKEMAVVDFTQVLDTVGGEQLAVVNFTQGQKLASCSKWYSSQLG